MGHYKKASKWRPDFIKALRNTGNVRAACFAAEIPRSTAYKHRDRSKEFAAAWDEAVEEACDAMEGEAFRRAMQGVEEPKIFKGMSKEGGPEFIMIKRYSDALLMFLLKAHRPGKFRERVEHTGEGGGPVTLHVVYDDDGRH